MLRLRIQNTELFWLGSRISILDHISESLITTFWVENTKILCCRFGIPVLFDPGSGMEKFESGINIPEQKHCFLKRRYVGIVYRNLYLLWPGPSCSHRACALDHFSGCRALSHPEQFNMDENPAPRTISCKLLHNIHEYAVQEIRNSAYLLDALWAPALERNLYLLAPAVSWVVKNRKLARLVRTEGKRSKWLSATDHYGCC